jgi:hypothetical protein
MFSVSPFRAERNSRGFPVNIEKEIAEALDELAASPQREAKREKGQAR